MGVCRSRVHHPAPHGNVDDFHQQGTGMRSGFDEPSRKRMRLLTPQPMPLRGSSNDCVDLESGEYPVRNSAGASSSGKKGASSSQEVEIVTVHSCVTHGAASSNQLRDQLRRVGGEPGRSRSRSPRFRPVRTPRQSAMARSDAELAAALQLEENTAAGLEGNAASSNSSNRPHHPEFNAPGREYLYVVEPCSRAIRCRGCEARINPRQPRVMFQRARQSKPFSAHVCCLAGIGGLVRPIRLPGGEDSGEVMMSALFQPDERAAIEAQLADLPAGPSEGGEPGEICHFEWPVRARQPEPVAAAAARLHAAARSGLGDLQRRLLSADRDFNPEDYEMLLQLDERAPGPASSQDELQVTMLLSQMPVSQLAATSAGTQCSICLEKMEAGNEVRTLPCMHFFHRVCIDKWISMPGAPAKCPIDQSEIDPARRLLVDL